MNVKNKRILIIEDDPDVREATKTNLALDGYINVSEANNGESGLQLTRKIKPALVLLDRKMPGKDGLQVLEEIKENFGDEVIVIMLTAYRDKDYVADAMRKGAFQYLVKDEDPDFALHTIESALRYHNKYLQRKKIEQEIYELMIENEEVIKNGYDFDYFKKLLKEKVNNLIDHVAFSAVTDCLECNNRNHANPNLICLPDRCEFQDIMGTQRDHPALRILHKEEKNPFFQNAIDILVPEEKQKAIETLIYVAFVERPSQKLLEFLRENRDGENQIRYCCIYIFCDKKLALSLEEKNLLKRFFDRFFIAMRMAKLVDKIDSLNRIRLQNEMAASIVHQISPLIIPLMDCLQSKNTAKHQRGLKIIENLQQMVQEFRDFTEGIRESYEKHKENIIKIIQKAELPLRLKYSSQIELSHNFPDHLSIKIWGDGKRLQQAFENIFMNAAQAILSSKQNSGRVEIEIRQKGQEVFIHIRDNGPGISSEIAPKLFNSYFSTKTAGMGLGLYLTAEIIRRHQGRIEINKSYQKGAEFIIALPIYQQE